MSLRLRVPVVVFGCLILPGQLLAGSVGGKLELPPPPERPPAATRGFLERVENPLAPPRPLALTPHMIVVLEGAAKPSSPGQVTWELVGESFARPVIAAPVGAEVVIKNVSSTARTLVATEDPQLVPQGPVNPSGSKSFRAAAAKVYTIGDHDAPHLTGRLVVVDTPFVASVDDAGKFAFADVPEGSYKLRIYYKDGWLEGSTDVQVGAKGKTDVNPKVPALDAPGKK